MPPYLQFVAVSTLTTAYYCMGGIDWTLASTLSARGVSSPGCVHNGHTTPQAHAADESCLSHRSQPDLLFASPKAGYDKVINENAVPHLFFPGLVSLIRPRS